MLFAIDEVENLGHRIYESLSVEDLNGIEEDLRSLGPEKWRNWCAEHTAFANQILAQQGQPLSGYSVTDRRRFSILLLEKLRKTAALLNTDFQPVSEARDVVTLVNAASALVENLESASRI